MERPVTETPTTTQNERSARRLASAAAWLLAAAVGAGAFGAHALEARLPPDLLATFETGAKYHLTQSLGVLGLALAAGLWRRWSLLTAGWIVVAGLVVFSGTLYVLALSGIRWMGAITPLGGVLLIVGWVWAAVALVRDHDR